MSSIRKEILVDATPEQVWDAIRDVGAVHVRLIPQRVVATRIEGNTHILTFANSNTARELIIDVDDTTRRLAYTVVEGRMPMQHHQAVFQIFPDGAQQTRLVWTTDFLPNELATEIRMRVEYGALDMKKALEDDARRA
jgi:hypothetical protein